MPPFPIYGLISDVYTYVPIPMDKIILVDATNDLCVLFKRSGCHHHSNVQMFNCLSGAPVTRTIASGARDVQPNTALLHLKASSYAGSYPQQCRKNLNLAPSLLSFSKRGISSTSTLFTSKTFLHKHISMVGLSYSCPFWCLT